LTSAIASGTGGFVINGENKYDDNGTSVSTAGDVNGDGLDDLIVGDKYADPNDKESAGKSYVIFGKKGCVVGFTEDDIGFACVPFTE
jgi:hypothetical protein